MVNLTKKPYNLSAEAIKWVQDTIEAMTDEEKVGQLFFQLTASTDEGYLKELVETYHVGGCRYNPMPGEAVRKMCDTLQAHTKIPLLIACNPEQGGNGACQDGTYLGSGIKIGATQNAEYAYLLGKYAGEEATAIGCNMAFSPVCDVLYEWQNSEVISRSFGNDPMRVAKMSKAYVDGAHTLSRYACAAKHFPGNGTDFRDAHISNNVNPMGERAWMQSYGAVYQTLIDGGVEAIMGGHIMMPNYMREVYGQEYEECLPATLCKEIMTDLLRERLGFNGMVVSDASHMVAMTNRMTRREMLPKCINAGCDMFLFFNDPKEDFQTMLAAYRGGAISKERMQEALQRILGLKAKLGLHQKQVGRGGTNVDLSVSLGKKEYQKTAERISEDAITLVKYKDEGVLPITPQKYRRIMIVPIGGAKGAMDDLVKMLTGAGERQKTPAEDLRDRLIERGFDAFLYESPIEQMKRRLAAGEQPNLNLYFAGKNAIADFKAEQDLIITLFDVNMGRPSFGMSKGGGEIPWYVFELPVVGISVNTPTMLADVPQLRTYINAYDAKPCTMSALVEKLMSGKEAFVGKDPIDSFCGLFDTRL